MLNSGRYAISFMQLTQLRNCYSWTLYIVCLLLFVCCLFVCCLLLFTLSIHHEKRLIKQLIHILHILQIQFETEKERVG